MKEIEYLNLHFPHKITIDQAQKIAWLAEKYCDARVSEGGFMPTNKYGLNVDNVTFSEDTMLWVYGYAKKQPKHLAESERR